MYFGCQPFIRYMICNYLLPFRRLPFHFVDGFLTLQKLLSFMCSELFVFASVAFACGVRCKNSWQRLMPRSFVRSFIHSFMSVAQLCLTLCDPIDCSPPGSSVHVILQARILEWVAMPFFRGSSWPRNWTRVSCTACRFFTFWATREAPVKELITYIFFRSFMTSDLTFKSLICLELILYVM